MKKLDKRVLNSIVRLQNDSDFAVFVEWLRESLNLYATMALREPVEPQRSWYQGKGQLLDELIINISKSREILEDIERGEGGGHEGI